MSGTWAGSMQAALAATLGHPRWWAMALAAFLVRGGILLVLFPLVSLPSAAGIANLVAPLLESIAIGQPSLQDILLGTMVIGVAIGGIFVAGVAGTWLDLALVAEAGRDEELELRRRTAAISPWRALAIRHVAHIPTLVALAYATVRLVFVTYDELLSPGDPSLPVAVRVLQAAPDALLVVAAAWLVGEVVGPLAARRVSSGERPAAALRNSVRQLAGPRGLATFVATSLLVLGLAMAFAFAVGQSWEHARSNLLDGADSLQLAAAVVLLAATWVLGLTLLGVALAWRATAWTVEAGPVVATSTEPAVAQPAEAAAG